MRRLLRSIGEPPLAVQLWNGEQIVPRSADYARLTIHDRRMFWKLLFDPVFQFGEGYSEGRLSVDGDLTELLVLLYRGLKAAEDEGRFRGGLARWLPRPRRDRRRRAADNVHHHYDIGNDFYRLWLDEELLYTCAYYPQPSYTLEQAQRAKIDHICRKLQLAPGETVVEAGCGWGALACHMARHYGVKVRAYNLSAEQIAYARERARKENLQGRVEFVQDDWRNISGRYDAFVSVGMLEHVGRASYGELSRTIDRCLAREGWGLIHSIGQVRPRPFDRWTETRIFPGAYPPALSEMTALLEPSGLIALDVENLRLHYARTLRDWLQRFEWSVDAVHRLFDARFVRMWRLYLAGSIAAFETGSLHLFQMLFSRASNNQVPRTRAYQYEPSSTLVWEESLR